MLRTILMLLMITLLVTACGHTRHGTRAHVYEQTAPSPADDSASRWHRPRDTETGAQYGQNVVFVSNDSKFSIQLGRVNPGELLRQTPIDSATGNGPSLRGISRVEKDNLIDKELWILTTISSLNPDDPLELRGKKYFKSSVLHLDSMDHSLIPLDEAERVLFTHESDTSYRVEIRIFEVDGALLKREIALAAEDPGLVEVVEAGAKTVLGTLGSAIGPTVSNAFKRYRDQPLAMERLLLASGAVEEFSGRFVVVRRGKFAENADLKPIRRQMLMLVDRYKGHSAPFDESQRKASLSALRMSQLCVKSNEKGPGTSVSECSGDATSYAFVEFNVDEIANPTQVGDTGLIAMSASDVQAAIKTERKEQEAAVNEFIGNKLALEVAAQFAKARCSDSEGSTCRDLDARVRGLREIANTSGPVGASDEKNKASSVDDKLAELRQLETNRHTEHLMNFVSEKCVENTELRRQIDSAIRRAGSTSITGSAFHQQFCTDLYSIKDRSLRLQQLKQVLQLIQRPND